MDFKQWLCFWSEIKVFNYIKFNFDNKQNYINIYLDFKSFPFCVIRTKSSFFTFQYIFFFPFPTQLNKFQSIFAPKDITRLTTGKPRDPVDGENLLVAKSLDVFLVRYYGWAFQALLA